MFLGGFSFLLVEEREKKKKKQEKRTKRQNENLNEIDQINSCFCSRMKKTCQIPIFLAAEKYQQFPVI